jgi:AcrR family transcriptional regulator
MNLRQTKRARQRIEIIENAIALFRERGIEDVRVREIAAICEISDATVFNYFPSKDAIIAEWAENRLQVAIHTACKGAGDRGLRRPIRKLVQSLAREVEADVAFMREAWGRARLIGAASSPWQPRGRGRGLPLRPSDAVRLIERAQARGELRADIPAEQLSEMLCGVLAATVAHWLASKAGEAGDEGLEVRLTRCADVLLDGYRKRNERVRVDTLRAGQPPRNLSG